MTKSNLKIHFYIPIHIDLNEKKKVYTFAQFNYCNINTNEAICIM